MSRPWYRSRLFWLGIPGLGFLLWLWLAKAREDLFVGHTRMSGTFRSTTRSIGAFDGYLYHFILRSRHGVSGPDEIGFHASSEVALEPDEPSTYFPSRPFSVEHEKSDNQEFRDISLAWWVVILAYTAIWLTALTLWQRRKAGLSRRAEAGES